MLPTKAKRIAYVLGHEPRLALLILDYAQLAELFVGELLYNLL